MPQYTAYDIFKKILTNDYYVYIYIYKLMLLNYNDMAYAVTTYPVLVFTFSIMIIICTSICIIDRTGIKDFTFKMPS